MILKEKIAHYKVDDEPETKTLLRVIINQLNSENDHENWDEIASFFEPAISVVRNPKSDKSRWNVLKREKVKSHWEKLDNHVQVKLRYILEYGDGNRKVCRPVFSGP